MSKGLYMPLEAPDHVFERTHDKLIINDLPMETLADREFLAKMAVTTYDKDVDTLASRPTCGCGFLKDTLHVKCPICKTRVDFDHKRPIESNLWVSCPEQFAGFFTPRVFQNLHLRFYTNGWSGWEWMCKTTAASPGVSNVSGNKIVEKFYSLNIPRGYGSVLDNLDKIVSLAASRQSGQAARDTIEFFKRYEKEILTQHLAMPSKLSLVLSKTSTGMYSDPALTNAMEAVLSAAGITRNPNPNIKALGNRVFSIQENLRKFFETQGLGKPLGAKGGYLRETVYGSRNNFSWRSTLVSEHEVHNHEETKIPYTEAVNVFDIHIANKLVHKHGMSSLEAFDYIRSWTTRISPLIMKILYELVEETPNGEGIWCLLIRYPTLTTLASSAFRIVGFNERYATNLSVLRMVEKNADCDGDQLTGLAALDNQTAEDFKKLRPHFYIHALNQPRTLNNNMALPDVTISVIHNWLETTDVERGLIEFT